MQACLRGVSAGPQVPLSLWSIAKTETSSRTIPTLASKHSLSPSASQSGFFAIRRGSREASEKSTHNRNRLSSVFPSFG